MNPRVTVLVATYRPGGAIAPLRGLRAQTLSRAAFDIVLVTEIGDAAWGGPRNNGLVTGVSILDAPALSFHAPTKAMNLGLDSINNLGMVAMLADYAYPDIEWLERLCGTLQSTGASFVGGMKCAHGIADPNVCEPSGGAAACRGHPFLPTSFIAETAVVYPCQSAFNLGNCIFRRPDALAINGFEERFAGAHGFEDEHFVRRLVALTKTQALMTRHAVLHHYWPYANGYKPLLKAVARPWAFGIERNADFDRLLLESETLVGNLKSQRVELPEVSSTMLVERTPALAFNDGEGPYGATEKP